ncbi:hypothetical protein ACHAPI_005163 [Fusarium lateritium]
MRLATIVAATGAIFTASVKGLACKDGIKYCSYNLQSGGHFRAAHLYELSKKATDSYENSRLLFELSSLLAQVRPVACCEAANDFNHTAGQAPILLMGVVEFVQARSEALLCETV